MSIKSLNNFMQEVQKINASFNEDISKSGFHKKELKRLMKVLKEKKNKKQIK